MSKAVGDSKRSKLESVASRNGELHSWRTILHPIKVSKLGIILAHTCVTRTILQTGLEAAEFKLPRFCGSYAMYSYRSWNDRSQHINMSLSRLSILPAARYDAIHQRTNPRTRLAGRTISKRGRREDRNKKTLRIFGRSREKQRGNAQREEIAHWNNTNYTYNFRRLYTREGNEPVGGFKRGHVNRWHGVAGWQRAMQCNTSHFWMESHTDSSNARRDSDRLPLPRVLRLPPRDERYSHCCARIYLQPLFQVDYRSLMLLSQRMSGTGTRKRFPRWSKVQATSIPSHPLVTFPRTAPHPRWPASSHSSSLKADK